MTFYLFLTRLGSTSQLPLKLKWHPLNRMVQTAEQIPLRFNKSTKKAPDENLQHRMSLFVALAQYEIRQAAVGHRSHAL